MNQEKIGKFIAEKRKEKKLTQQQLAEIKSYNEIISFSNDLNIFDASLIKLLNS